MDIGTISSRYAKALFSLAKDKEQESRVYDDMKMLADSFSMEPELRGALSNPIVSVPEKVKLLTAAGGIEVCELYSRFINLVLALHRIHLYPFVPEREKDYPGTIRHGRSGRRCGQVSPARQATERDGMHDRVLRPCGTGTNRGLPPTHRQLPDRRQLCDATTGYPYRATRKQIKKKKYDRTNKSE